MSRNPQILAMLLLAASLAGCAAQPLSPVLSVKSSDTAISAMGIPPASAFVTVKATVKTILPLDTQGLPHQNFVVVANGQTYEVNNDTKYGSEVPGLKVGMVLTIKGTTYKDTHKQGIHWTHHANQLGDAGWIKTPDGKLYE